MATTFEVLAEPTRRRILDLLLERSRPVGELVALLGLSQPGVSKHLRILREGGFVEVRRDAQRRFYVLRAAPLAEVDAWLAPYRRLWADRLDALERHLDATADTSLAADGTLETCEGRHVLRYERRLAHPIDRVWAAVTEPGELRGWLADAEIDLVAGGRVRLRWLNTDDEGNEAVATGQVSALDPPRVVQFATE